MGHVSSDGGAPLVGVSIALSVLQIVFVAARFYTRFVQRVRCGVDDYVILFALVCMLPIVSPLNILILILSPIRLEVSPRRLSILSVSTALLSAGQPMELIYLSVVEAAGLGYHFDEDTHPASNLAFIRKV